MTRWDCHKYAREAYEIGVRYIGACCGMEPYHVRAIAEELSEERGCLPPGSEKHGLWGDGLRQHTKPWVRARYVLNTSVVARPIVVVSSKSNLVHKGREVQENYSCLD